MTPGEAQGWLRKRGLSHLPLTITPGLCDALLNDDEVLLYLCIEEQLMLLPMDSKTRSLLLGKLKRQLVGPRVRRQNPMDKFGQYSSDEWISAFQAISSAASSAAGHMATLARMAATMRLSPTGLQFFRPTFDLGDPLDVFLVGWPETDTSGFVQLRANLLSVLDWLGWKFMVDRGPAGEGRDYSFLLHEATGVTMSFTSFETTRDVVAMLYRLLRWLEEYDVVTCYWISTMDTQQGVRSGFYCFMDVRDCREVRRGDSRLHAIMTSLRQALQTHATMYTSEWQLLTQLEPVYAISDSRLGSLVGDLISPYGPDDDSHHIFADRLCPCRSGLTIFDCTCIRKPEEDHEQPYTHNEV